MCALPTNDENFYRIFEKLLRHSPTSYGCPIAALLSCRKRKYVRALTHFKAIYFFYVHNNLCSAFFVSREENEGGKNTKQQITSHARAPHTSEWRRKNLQTTNPPFIAARHGIIIYTWAETWLFQITIALYFWPFVRTMALCCVHAFVSLFPLAFLSLLIRIVSKRKIFVACTMMSRGVSQVEFSLNVLFCLLSLHFYICTVPLRTDKPRIKQNKKNSNTGRLNFHSIYCRWYFYGNVHNEREIFLSLHNVIRLSRAYHVLAILHRRNVQICDTQSYTIESWHVMQNKNSKNIKQKQNNRTDIEYRFPIDWNGILYKKNWEREKYAQRTVLFASFFSSSPAIDVKYTSINNCYSSTWILYCTISHSLIPFILVRWTVFHFGVRWASTSIPLWMSKCRASTIQRTKMQCKCEAFI